MKVLSLLIPLKYGNWNTEKFYKPTINEISAHFDQTDISGKIRSCLMEYSLHTEYSMDKRGFKCELLKNFPNLLASHHRGVPELWKDKHWAAEFASFVIQAVGKSKPPTMIEIHPPFRSYCSSIGSFMAIYQVFEDKILNYFPETKILLENRNGSSYQISDKENCRFLIRKIEELSELKSEILSLGSRLTIALDFPQLISAHSVKLNKPVNDLGTGEWGLRSSDLQYLFRKITEISSHIECLHLWSRKKLNNNRDKKSHHGNLDDWFNYDRPNHKHQIISNLFKALGDGKPRYFVPEVNSNQSDLEAIINDMIQAGFVFK